MAKKKAEEIPEAKGVLTDLLNRLLGKESALSIDLDNVGVDLGEGRQINVSGKMNLSLTTLK